MMQQAGERSSRAVLLIEHDYQVERSFVRAGRADGIDVSTLFDGTAAVELVAEQPPDLILLDLGLSEIDGRDVLRDLKWDPRTKHIPVLVFGDRLSEKDRASLLELGADDCFETPLAPEALFRVIHRRIDRLRDDARITGSGSRTTTPSERPTSAVITSIGDCHHCESYRVLRPLVHVPTGHVGWYCFPCRSKGSADWRVAEPRDVDRYQAEVLRIAGEDRTSYRPDYARPARAALAPVLIVEDDRDIRESVCAVLEAERIETLTACNGQEAIELLRSRPAAPSAILLDLMMPVMDGWELRRRLMEDHSIPAAPIVIMSARPRDRSLGPIPWLQKPLHVDELLTTIRRQASVRAG